MLARLAVSSADRLVRQAQHPLGIVQVVIVRPLRTAAQRRELSQLSNSQLRDAGIDPVLARPRQGRRCRQIGPARLLSLTQG